MNDFEKRLPEIVKSIKRQNTVVQFTSSQISIRTFGKMQVKLGDHLVNSSDWQSQTSRDLFFYILAHPAGVTKEQVGAAFWPDSSSEELKIRFKNAIYRMRRAVGIDTVTYENEIYAFNRKTDYDYDAERFSRDLAQARSSSELDLQIKYFKTAVAAYQGVYLPKIEQTWVLPQRQQYEVQFIEAALKLANLMLQQGNPQSVLVYTKRILEQDPCNEAAYRINMQAYSTLGDRSSVKRAYEMCKHTLLNELGVEPSETTEQLLNALMS